MKLKDGLLLVSAVVLCPCHLPFVLPALAGLLAGTGAGAFISANTGVLIGGATAGFVAIAYFSLRRVSDARRSEPIEGQEKNSGPY
jgi:hypothetical protein